MPKPVYRSTLPDVEGVTPLVRKLEKALEEKRREGEEIKEAIQALEKKYNAARLFEKMARADDPLQVPLDEDSEQGTGQRKNASPTRLLAFSMKGNFMVRHISDCLSLQGDRRHRSSVRETLDRMVADGELALVGESETGSRHYKNLQVTTGNETPDARPA